MTQQQVNALRLIVSAIVDAVKAAGPIGAPGGVLYAALMTHGVTLEQFEKLMSGLVHANLLRRQGDCYLIP